MNCVAPICRTRTDRKLGAILLVGCLLFGSLLRAQTPAPVPPPVVEENAPPKLPPEALNQLLAPIALYPDAMVALILPASTVPSDVVLAARYLSSNGDPAQIPNQPWDESVRSLARYPDVVKWMDQNLEWTTQVGDAFLNQPADVMNTIQQLRAQAIAAGTLVDCPQQRVVKEESYIRIIPAEPDVIYVPQYDPEVVYVQPYEPYGPYFGPALTFGIGFAVGSWLNYDCDWPRRRVCVGDWKPGWKRGWGPGWKQDWKWNRGGDYAVNVVNISSESARVWEPSERVRRQNWQRQRNFNDSNATAFSVTGRRGSANDPRGRFATVARPSLLNVGDPNGGQNRRGGRRSDPNASNFSRNLPGEVGNSPPGSQSIQGERGNQGNGNREAKGRGRAREQGNSAGNLSREIGDPSAIPGPQPGQTEQWNRGNGNREAKGKENSKAIAKSVSAGGRGNGGDNSKGRKARADSESVGAIQSSPSVSEQVSRSKNPGSARSKANDSAQKFKGGRSKAPRSEASAQSFAKPHKQAQGVSNKSKGGSPRQEAAIQKSNKGQPPGGGKKGGGGGQKSGQKGGKGKDKGKN